MKMLSVESSSVSSALMRVARSKGRPSTVCGRHRGLGAAPPRSRRRASRWAASSRAAPLAATY